MMFYWCGFLKNAWYKIFIFIFSKALRCKSLMVSSKWMCLFKKCMQCTKASPSVQFERLFSWICYEMLVDKYANMNIENICSILLYELTHLICWLKAYSSEITAHGRVCLCVSALSQALRARSAERGSLRKHPRTSRLHKHTCITKIRCRRAYCTISKHALIAFIKIPMSY